MFGQRVTSYHKAVAAPVAYSMHDGVNSKDLRQFLFFSFFVIMGHESYG